MPKSKKNKKKSLNLIFTMSKPSSLLPINCGISARAYTRLVIVDFDSSATFSSRIYETIRSATGEVATKNRHVEDIFYPSLIALSVVQERKENRNKSSTTDSFLCTWCNSNPCPSMLLIRDFFLLWIRSKAHNMILLMWSKSGERKATMCACWASVLL